MADVRLTDLEVIQRYSIAVRGETAERDELMATLRADLAWLQGSGGRRGATDDVTPAKARAAAKRVTKPAAKKVAKPAKAPARRGR